MLGRFPEQPLTVPRANADLDELERGREVVVAPREAAARAASYNALAGSSDGARSSTPAPPSPVLQETSDGGAVAPQAHGAVGAARHKHGLARADV